MSICMYVNLVGMYSNKYMYMYIVCRCTINFYVNFPFKHTKIRTFYFKDFLF